MDVSMKLNYDLMKLLNSSKNLKMQNVSVRDVNESYSCRLRIRGIGCGCLLC